MTIEEVAAIVAVLEKAVRPPNADANEASALTLEKEFREPGYFKNPYHVRGYYTIVLRRLKLVRLIVRQSSDEAGDGGRWHLSGEAY